MESKAWRRGFLGGFAALLISVAGQVATSSVATPETCSVRRVETPVAQTLIDRLAHRSQAGLTQRVALAVLSAVLLHRCS